MFVEVSMDANEPRRDADSERLPEQIIEHLRNADRSVSSVDARTDETVLAEARAHFARRPHRLARMGRRRVLRIAALAAVLAGVFLIVHPIDRLRPARDANDIDGSGRVDILDAFSLARMRAAGRPVSQEQIDELAARIVSLDASRRLR
jgi:hypothetical protein